VLPKAGVAKKSPEGKPNGVKVNEACNLAFRVLTRKECLGVREEREVYIGANEKWKGGGRKSGT